MSNEAREITPGNRPTTEKPKAIFGDWADTLFTAGANLGVGATFAESLRLSLKSLTEGRPDQALFGAGTAALSVVVAIAIFRGERAFYSPK